jgi:hypothetical protein
VAAGVGYRPAPAHRVVSPALSTVNTIQLDRAERKRPPHALGTPGGSRIWYRPVKAHRVVPPVINPNPGGYIKSTSTGGIKFILTFVSEGGGGGGGNGHICVDFISMNEYGLCTHKLFML